MGVFFLNHHVLILLSMDRVQCKGGKSCLLQFVTKAKPFWYVLTSMQLYTCPLPPFPLREGYSMLLVKKIPTPTLPLPLPFPSLPFPSLPKEMHQFASSLLCAQPTTRVTPDNTDTLRSGFCGVTLGVYERYV